MVTDSIPLNRSLAIQSRVIGALLMREILTRYGRYNIGVLWLICEPLLFTLAISVLWYVGKVGSFTLIPIIAFAITGFSSASVWRDCVVRCSHAIEPNQGLLYHRNVKVLDIFISRVLLELVGTTASLAALTVFFAAIGAMQWPQDIFLVVSGWLLLCWSGFALACIVGIFSERSKFFNTIVRPVTFLLYHASGTIFMADWLPPGLQDALLCVPMLHGTEMVRHGYFGSIVPTHENPLYLIVANLLLTLFGLALVRASGRKVQNQ